MNVKQHNNIGNAFTTTLITQTAAINQRECRYQNEISVLTVYILPVIPLNNCIVTYGLYFEDVGTVCINWMGICMYIWICRPLIKVKRGMSILVHFKGQNNFLSNFHTPITFISILHMSYLIILKLNFKWLLYVKYINHFL